MFSDYFDQLYYEGNREVSYIVSGCVCVCVVGFFFFWSGLVKTWSLLGGESWQEVITQVLDVALTFEFSFLYALFRALIIVGAFT
jgi:uncharacterized membrane protein HdeD (DUF308 family)